MRRRGDRMVIECGAALPPRCFVSGQPTDLAVDVDHVWQPQWVYLLLLPGLLPYFFASPFLSRKLHLRVPIARDIYRGHLKKVTVGFAMVVAGILVAASAALLGNLIPSLYSFIAIGILVGIAGIFVASRQPIRLQVESLQSDVLVLRGVHPACLNGLADEW